MFIIVGMNSIFIYLFFSIGGAELHSQNYSSIQQFVVFVGRRRNSGDNYQSWDLGCTMVYVLLAV